MLYIFMVLPGFLGATAILMGVDAIRNSSIQLSPSKTLHGRSATAVGIIIIVIGMLLIGYAVTFPFILRAMNASRG